MVKILLQIGLLTLLSTQLIQAAVLNCNFSNGWCNIVNISDVASANEQVTVSGQPADFKDTQTTSISFAYPTKLSYIPSSIFDIFPNINSFSLSNVSLVGFVSNNFRNCGLLTTIQISQNNFKTLPASIAPTCINVTTLYLMSNNIETLDADSLKGLTFLNMLMLRDNKISCIPPGFFQHTSILQSIDLASNLITKIDPQTFRGLPNLNVLSLGSNKIASIPVFDLKYTAMTMGLNLMMENNPIVAIHPQFLTQLFSQRSYMSSTMINFFDSYGNTTTCFPKNNMYTSSISSWNWATANVSLGACYENWSAEYESPVSCASIISTTAAPTTAGSNSNEDLNPWGKKKNFFAIISNAMRNFTANVQFY